MAFKDEILRREKKGGKSASRKAPSRGRPFTEDSENCQELLTAGAREGHGTRDGLRTLPEGSKRASWRMDHLRWALTEEPEFAKEDSIV